MKTFLTIIALFVHLLATAQQAEVLKEYNSGDGIPKGKVAFYGMFVQRLGFSSGGFPQDIQIMNVDTRALYTFRVKPTFKSARKNIFCFIAKPGTYVIVNYWWTQSKFYGGESTTERVLKPQSGKPENLESYYSFTLEDNKVSYLGTWHFDKTAVSFTDDKTKQDAKMWFVHFDLEQANTEIPH